MPDLDIVAMRMCATNRYWQATVASESESGQSYLVRFEQQFGERRNYEYDYTCSCPHYRYRKAQGTYCKHIERAKKFRCGWHEQWGGDGPSTDKDPLVELSHEIHPETGLDPCPCCGASTEAVRVAV